MRQGQGGEAEPVSVSPQVIRAELVSRLRARRPEIEKAIIARVQSLVEPVDVLDPTYLVGVKDAVAAAVNYSLLAIRRAAIGRPRSLLR